MRKSVFTELLHHFQPFTADLIYVCLYCTLYTVQCTLYMDEKYFQEAATGHVHCRTLVAVAERFM
jgi:hypothetical protein